MLIRPSPLIIEAARFAVRHGVELGHSTVSVHVVSGKFRGSLENMVTSADLDSATPTPETTSMPESNSHQQEPAGSRVLMFSPTEAAILQVCSREWQTAQEIADKCGMKCSSAFYTLLGNLAERNALESGRAGYRWLTCSSPLHNS